jgi:hypothetical protein
VADGDITNEAFELSKFKSTILGDETMDHWAMMFND